MHRPALAVLLFSSLALPAQARWQVTDPPPPPPVGEEEVWALPGDPPAPPPAPAQPAPPPPDAAAQAAPEGAAAGPLDQEAWEAEQAYFDEQDRLAEAAGEEAGESAAVADGDEEIGTPAPERRSVTRAARDDSSVISVDQPFFSLFAYGILGEAAPSRPSETTSFDFGMRFEGERFGFLARMGVIGPSNGTDYFNMTLEPTFAVVANERFRLRLRAGWGLASNDAITMGGLSLGTSMVLCLVGPLDLEADVTAVPFPFTRVDTTVGLALNLGAVSVRAGWRSAYQDDQRHTNGSSLSVRSAGVYGGFGLHF